MGHQRHCWRIYTTVIAALARQSITDSRDKLGNDAIVASLLANLHYRHCWRSRQSVLYFAVKWVGEGDLLPLVAFPLHLAGGALAKSVWENLSFCSLIYNAPQCLRHFGLFRLSPHPSKLGSGINKKSPALRAELLLFCIKTKSRCFCASTLR